MFLRLLGFDLRMAPERFASSEWSLERRKTYLLNPEIPWPLSVDTTVWPTVFQYGEDAGGTDPQTTVQIEASDFYQDVLGLWANPSDMLRAAEKSRAPIISNAVPIAVELVSVVPLTSIDYWRAVLDESYTAKPINSDWLCLGYDVADSSRISGLSNCSYTDQDKLRLARDWGNALNKFGLFQNREGALEFAGLTDRRVPEHAPFFAYGLYSNRKPGPAVAHL